MVAKKKKVSDKVVEHYADVVAAVDDVTQEVAVPNRLMDESVPPGPRREVDVAYTLAKQSREDELAHRIAVLEDAIRQHRSLCHRMGTRQCDSQLHALVPAK